MLLCVVDDSGRYADVVTRAQLELTQEADRSKAQVQSVLPSGIEPLSPEQPLDDALQQLADHGVAWLPVVVGNRVVGGLGVRDVIATYKKTLPRSARRTRALPSETSVFDVQLRADSVAAGRMLRDAALPVGVLVVAIRREGETMFPMADSRLEAGDVLTLVADPSRETEVKSFFDPTVTSV